MGVDHPLHRLAQLLHVCSSTNQHMRLMPACEGHLPTTHLDARRLLTAYVLVFRMLHLPRLGGHTGCNWPATRAATGRRTDYRPCYGCRYVNWGGRVFGEHVAVHAAALILPMFLGRKAWVSVPQQCCLPTRYDVASRD